ncbi:MAG: hypothetical protein ACE5OZ_07405 [Candidatus Heimdallarchaeota archaeon]
MSEENQFGELLPNEEEIEEEPLEETADSDSLNIEGDNDEITSVITLIPHRTYHKYGSDLRFTKGDKTISDYLDPGEIKQLIILLLKQL